jgi:hypothetical protein
MFRFLSWILSVSLFRPLLLLAVLLLSTSTSAHRAHCAENTGIGVIIGDPTGLTLRHYQSDERTWDGTLSFDWDQYVEVTANPSWLFPEAFSKRDRFLRDLTPYLGIGGALVFYGEEGLRRWRRENEDNTQDVSLGIRVPIGIEWKMQEAPLSLFLELAPGIGLVPGTFTFLEGGVGIRYLL